MRYSREFGRSRASKTRKRLTEALDLPKRFQKPRVK